MIKKIIDAILRFFHLIPKKAIEKEKELEKPTYQLKNIMTQYERNFYYKLKRLGDNYEIMPQINLASIVKKIDKSYYYTDLFRNIDFAIFTKNYEKLLLLIEINDSTHQQKSRRNRDLKVEKICNEIGIKLIKFYTCYPNEESYVINRILNEINEVNQKEDLFI